MSTKEKNLVSFDDLFNQAVPEEKATQMQKSASQERPSVEQLYEMAMTNTSNSQEETMYNNQNVLYQKAAHYVAAAKEAAVQEEMNKQAAAAEQEEVQLLNYATVMQKQAQAGVPGAYQELQKVAYEIRRRQENYLGQIFGQGVIAGLRKAAEEGVNIPVSPENGGSQAPGAIPNDGTAMTQAPAMTQAVNPNTLAQAAGGTKSLKAIAEAAMKGTMLGEQVFPSGSATQFPIPGK